MSVESVALVLNYSRATGRDKLVLVGIANHDGDGGAWPSIETLARYANASERSVQRSIVNLVDLGELEVDRNAGGRAHGHGGRRPNLYRILVTRPDPEPVDNPDRGVTTPVTPQPTRGDKPGSPGVTPVGVQKVLRTTTPLTPHCERHRRHRDRCPECVAAAAPKPEIPAWCGHCDPAGQHDPGQRLVEVRTRGMPVVVKKCPRCHPSTQRRTA